MCDSASSCLLCTLPKRGSKVPHPSFTTVQVSRPIEIIHFSYVFLGQSDKQNKYALLIKNDLSSYVWLDPSASTDSGHAAKVFSSWTRLVTALDMCVSDQRSQFKNEVLDHLSSTQLIRHSPTVAYFPWVNGTVEPVMRSVLSATKAMQGSLRLAPQDWSSLLPAIAIELNEASLERL